jgi:hypothetical protein
MSQVSTSSFGGNYARNGMAQQRPSNGQDDLERSKAISRRHHAELSSYLAGKGASHSRTNDSTDRK